MKVVPMTLRQARALVYTHHRHHKRVTGGLWAIAAMDDEGQEILGVAIVGRPVSGELQRRGYAEILRVCVFNEHPHACSFLLGRCRRIAQAFGYSRVVTYTLSTEPGTSVRAAGFAASGRVRARSWSTPSRPRRDKLIAAKVRWES